MAFSALPLFFHAIFLLFFVSACSGGPSSNSDGAVQTAASFAVTEYNRHEANGSPLALCRVIAADNNRIDQRTVYSLTIIVKSTNDGSTGVVSTTVFVKNDPDAPMVSNHFEFIKNLSSPGEGMECN
ncbi:hypothetical protein KSP40_PGU003759 [Platanthera guangdongensis]|uniref:Cystatin domain-containing protein n=1 Tax=Platanthera guangdongensis TaxID=2320717 RepID=A0ABR2LNV3_9ASPA